MEDDEQEKNISAPADDGDDAIRAPLEEALEDDEIDPAEEGFVRGYQEEREEEWDV